MTSAMAPLSPISPGDFVFEDAFWSGRRDVVRGNTIPFCLKMVEEKGFLENFRLAARKSREGFSGSRLSDADVFRLVEAMAVCHDAQPNEEFATRMGEIVELIAGAQEPDGYLHTYTQIVEPERRFSNLRDSHELLCGSALVEAAMAHRRATGDDRLLAVALRFAELLVRTFGTEGDLADAYPGFPGIETTLIELGRLTGRQEFIDLGCRFIDLRGTQYFAREQLLGPGEYNGVFWQDDVPVRDFRYIHGHAHRIANLLCGAVEVARETRDERLYEALGRVWANAVERRLYLTGGAGSTMANEGFSADYDLPNASATQDVFSSMALAEWAFRMTLLTGHGRHADILERIMFNAFAASLSLKGERYFLTLPLESNGEHVREEWFSPASPAPSIARYLSALGEYVAAVSGDSIYLLFFAQGRLFAPLEGGRVEIAIETDFPWDGRMHLTPRLDAPRSFRLCVRIPEWQEGYTVKVNQLLLGDVSEEDGFLVIDRTWEPGDSLEVCFPMHVRRLEAHPAVTECAGKVAIRRGPFIYCLEGCDYARDLDEIRLPADQPISEEVRLDLLGGVVVITMQASVAARREWEGVLYQPEATLEKTLVAAVPYYVWGNRGAGAMRVWIPVS